MQKIKLFIAVAIHLLIVLHSYSDNVVRGCVRSMYESQIGVREATGKNDGIDVEKYLKSVSQTKGAPWCAAFVNWTLKHCYADYANSAWSPSWFPKSRIIYQSGKVIEKPKEGDVFGIYFANLKRIAHVGFVDKWDDSETVITVEGNTNGQGSREGNGVYRKRRLKSQIYVVSKWIKS